MYTSLVLVALAGSALSPALSSRTPAWQNDYEQAYRQMTTAINPYGDGLASERIVEVLRNWRAGRPLLAEERSFSPRPRLTTSPQDLQNLPTAAQDIGLFSDAVRMRRTVWPRAASATAKPIVPEGGRV